MLGIVGLATLGGKPGCARGVRGLGLGRETCILPQFHYPEEMSGDAR
jgi:hypothetical protein